MTVPSRRLGAVDLEEVVWASNAIVCVVTDRTGVIVAANQAFVRQARANPIGQALVGFVGEGQTEAFESWLGSIGPAWEARTWGALPDVHDLPRDFRLTTCRRADGSVVTIGERLEVEDVASALMTVNENVVREHRRIDRERGRLDRMTQEDALTGVANRRAFDLRLAQQVEGARPGSVFAVVILDLDHFKNVNDRYGHPVGDAVLRWLGALLRAAARKSDFVARYGGEEFVAILPGTDEDGAFFIADAFRESLFSLGIVHTGGDKGVVTASVGLATFTERDRGMNATELVRRADEALYKAKGAGRDRVTGWRPRHEVRPVRGVRV